VAAIVARMLVLDGPWQAEPGGLFAAWVGASSDLAFACGAPFMIAMAREQLEPVGAYLLVLSVGTLVATLVDPDLAPWCVVAGALLLARVASQWGKGTRERRWVLGVCVAVLGAHALAGLLVEPDMALHETRVEIARGLR